MTSLSMFSQFLTNNPVLTLLLIAHFLADFQWQSQKMAELKSYKWAYLLKHLFIVALPLILIAFLVPRSLFLVFLIFISHAVIDTAKLLFYPLYKSHSLAKEIFIIDQTLHLLINFILYQIFGKSLSFWPANLNYFLKLFLFLVLITKPINIIFKLFFNKYQVKDKVEDETIIGAGATIGVLERFIMGIFLLFGQFASIGLVFAAKSIARYDKISKNQAFAEYYLIGSLFSIISVLTIYAICIL
ncbi:DUF3307 domain-containing protein [Streptococcus macacae]|uniref:Membrane protein n=1 Tax=Streptococcus macacae NCTC 11558 TaxID=764298 RepID=G5JUB1_9STRE|nr:DUF3307 domain-containing protein [Streptococcus macacae]EHJ52278.1 putative membrane protein [Streptococcus macacae NCTC 11558]SUN78474.1 putative satE protein [Streptococcus macacae NCTC 11558]